MLLAQMLAVCFFPVEDPSAYGAVGSVVRDTKPAGDVEVLGALVALPVSLAAEGFGTVWECAAIRPFVTFLVLPDGSLLDDIRQKDRGRATHFISQRSRVRLKQISH